MISRLLAYSGALLLAAFLTLTAGMPVAADGVPVPHPPKGKGDQCVAGTDFMRRNHPDLLRHQRDDTLRLGIRGENFSLKECVSCHSVAGKDAKPVTYDSPQHFCRTCHTYAAVRIDCFECHNSVPDGRKKAGLAPAPATRPNVLSAWRSGAASCLGG